MVPVYYFPSLYLVVFFVLFFHSSRCTVDSEVILCCFGRLRTGGGASLRQTKANKGKGRLPRVFHAPKSPLTSITLKLLLTDLL